MTIYTYKELQEDLFNQPEAFHNLPLLKKELRESVKDENEPYSVVRNIIYATIYYLLPASKVANLISVKNFLKDCIFETGERFRNMWKYRVFAPSKFGYSMCDVIYQKAIPMLKLYKQQYIKGAYCGIPIWLDKSEIVGKVSKQDEIDILAYIGDLENNDISNEQVIILQNIWILILDNMIYGLGEQSETDWYKRYDICKDFGDLGLQVIRDKQIKAKSDLGRYLDDLWI